MINKNYDIASKLADLGAKTIWLEDRVDDQLYFIAIRAERWEDFRQNYDDLNIEDIERKNYGVVFHQDEVSIRDIQDKLNDDFIDIGDTDEASLYAFFKELKNLIRPDSLEQPGSSEQAEDPPPPQVA
jgi:hypothetical protein